MRCEGAATSGVEKANAKGGRVGAYAKASVPGVGEYMHMDAIKGVRIVSVANPEDFTEQSRYLRAKVPGSSVCSGCCLEAWNRDVLRFRTVGGAVDRPSR